MTRARFTAGERARALALADEIGAAEASRQLGIPAQTIGAWRVKRRTDPASYVETASESKDLGDDDALSDRDLQRLQREASSAFTRALRSGKGAEAKAIAVSLGIIDDKLSKRARERRAATPLDDRLDITDRTVEILGQLVERHATALFRADDETIARAIRRRRDDVRRLHGQLAALQAERQRRRMGLPRVDESVPACFLAPTVDEAVRVFTDGSPKPEGPAPADDRPLIVGPAARPHVAYDVEVLDAEPVEVPQRRTRRVRFPMRLPALGPASTDEQLRARAYSDWQKMRAVEIAAEAAEQENGA